MRVLAVGIATLDIINVVASYPAEDAELRALAQRVRRGGNAGNTLAVLGQLGHIVHWAGTLASDADSQVIVAALQREGIEHAAARRYEHGHSPTSYITLSQATGSRTIVHVRDLPEYEARDFARIDLTAFDWVHFEGRHVPALGAMLERVRAQGIRCSLEIEKPRPGIENLFALPDVLLFSRHYARTRGYASAASLLQALAPDVAAERYCAWGEEGAWAMQRDGRLAYAPAYPPRQLVDTLGAGDVFNAGVIDGRLRGLDVTACLEQACRLAGRKCGMSGFEGLGR